MAKKEEILIKDVESKVWFLPAVIRRFLLKITTIKVVYILKIHLLENNQLIARIKFVG